MDFLKTLLISVILALPMISCESFDEVYPYEIYSIKKGQHYSTKKISSLQTDGIQFIARFDESAIYETKTAENQYDINKLMGFSDLNSLHHDNSARFGWRWAEGSLQIFSYVYIDGERISDHLGDVPLNQDIEFQLLLTDDSYLFSLNGQEAISVARTSNQSNGLAYMLYPYFGGDEPAPQDINIMIKMLY
jgi:hypothetical protein